MKEREQIKRLHIGARVNEDYVKAAKYIATQEKRSFSNILELALERYILLYKGQNK